MIRNMISSKRLMWLKITEPVDERLLISTVSFIVSVIEFEIAPLLTYVNNPHNIITVNVISKKPSMLFSPSVKSLHP